MQFITFMKDENFPHSILDEKGEFIDTPSGRTVNPGHAIETAWFIMEEAKYRNDKALLEKILPVLNWHLELGWDTEHGGLLSFKDCKGFQSEQIEWDMKFWWPHNEALYASLLAYQMTGESRYACWFEKIHNWVDSHFPDRESGEWFGYLHYDGTVANTLKGNNWKSFFHLPRQQLFTWKLLEEMLN
jgi:N-acylglucosamine 2-epimerase